MIAAIYARKSTDQTGVADEAKSVERQTDHARAYAIQKGWSVAKDCVFIRSPVHRMLKRLGAFCARGGERENVGAGLRTGLPLSADTPLMFPIVISGSRVYKRAVSPPQESLDSLEAMPRRTLAIADATNMLLASALAGRLAWRVITATDARWIPFALGILAGFFAADVLSGLVHWFCDTYFQPETTLIGPMLIAPFREHHVDPAALGRHGVLERNGNNCLAALPLLAFGALGPWDLARPGPALGIGFLAAAALTLCMTNQIHAWAHTSSAPRIVRWLQRGGILLAPERHARHHDGSHKHAYAVVSGWSNLGLDWILERRG